MTHMHAPKRFRPEDRLDDDQVAECCRQQLKDVTGGKPSNWLIVTAWIIVAALTLANLASLAVWGTS